MKGNRNDTVCNYCVLVIRSDGITRFKFHLSHSDPYSNTKKLLKCASRSEIRNEATFDDEICSSSKVVLVRILLLILT